MLYFMSHSIVLEGTRSEKVAVM